MCKAAKILIAEEQFQCFVVRTWFSLQIRLKSQFTSMRIIRLMASLEVLASPLYPGASTVIAAKKKWDRYRFLCRSPSQQVFSFVIEVQDRWRHCARHLFKRLFSKIPIAVNRVSHNYCLKQTTHITDIGSLIKVSLIYSQL